ncbi:hypothetical protein MLD38_008926 [Melastoma candidum]|uniref:Uncharacterized protein n=1 Tax=Melastoma candidum TaxID=119954 RepID=A0ACB9RWG7_9MYRT|nr:hypothetical protein MLD38_008926 [Melastoma candidum]
MYGVDDILGIEGGYRGFYSKNTLQLTQNLSMTSIHVIVDNIQDRGINQVYIIGGDGTQRGAALIYRFCTSLKATS